MSAITEFLLKFYKEHGAKALVGLFIPCCIVLFASDKFLKKLGLDTLRNNHTALIGIIWLVTLSLLVCHVFGYMHQRTKAYFKIRQLAKGLRNLTEEEQMLLANCLHNRTKTMHLDYCQGIARSLEGVGIIYRASSVGIHGTVFAYNIQPWAWKYLNEHPDVLSRVREQGEFGEGIE